MVKTNKKSLIAMIAMVVLLIASIAMGITGAWFTAQKSVSDGDASLKFGTVAVEGTISGMQVQRNGTWENYEANMVVMPGDKVKGGEATFTITTTDKAGVYYLIKSGDEYYTATGAKYTSGALTAAATTGSATVKFTAADEGSYVGGAEGSEIANTQQNKAVTVTAGSYTIYVIQASNISAANAAQTIMDLVDGTFPANASAAA